MLDSRAAAARTRRKRAWLLPCPLLFLLVCVAPAAGQSGGPRIDEPLFAEVPNACSHLTEELAGNLLRAKVRPGPANEHIPTFWSQCVYHGQGVRSRIVGFVFKFMLYELFDVATLDAEQLRFNATFAAQGTPPLERLDHPGKVAFTYEKKDQSMLLVVTGFQGPPDSAGRPQEFIAFYDLSDPDTSHEVRLEKLVEQARRHMAAWRAGT